MKFKVRKNLLKVVLYVLCIFFLVLGIVLLLNAWEQRHYSYTPESSGDGETTQSTQTVTPDLEYNGTGYKLNKNIETVLLVGVDKYLASTDSETYINSEQADFIMLVVIDTKNESYKVLHINRDTMTDVQVLGVTGVVAFTRVEQIALAHTYGSGQEDSAENTVDAVSQLLYDVDIDHYITVTMDAVAIINDAVGGVTVTALDTINDDIVEGEEVTLLGENALAYVRTRYGLDDSSNLHRMERQEQYLKALMEKFKEACESDSDFALDTALEITSYMVSDCTVNELSDIYSAMSDYELSDYLTLEGEATVGDTYMEFYVDEDALYELYLDLFYTVIE
ncbi:MAG: LCP family protein [Oscillospiraceae bacterium]|nr:LCP family protein [Oscillospiraceae bacterium]